MTAISLHRRPKRFSVALVHYPVLDKTGAVQCTSITNLDVHDIARSATTYGLDAFYIVTPIEAQQEMARSIVGYWQQDAGKQRNADRANALECVQIMPSLLAVQQQEQQFTEMPVILISTSAKHTPHSLASENLFQTLPQNSVAILVLGTGHGLAKDALEACSVMLDPILGLHQYNHLSVRSAAAILFDRIHQPCFQPLSF